MSVPGRAQTVFVVDGEGVKPGPVVVVVEALPILLLASTGSLAVVAPLSSTARQGGGSTLVSSQQ